MSGYRNLAVEHLSTILAEYELGRSRRCVHIERGYVNEKWLLETERGQYLLKRRHCSLRKPSLVQAQHGLVQHLCNSGFPAPGLVRTRRSRTYLAHGGEIYELQEFVNGDPFDAAEPAHLVSSARMLAFYHNVVKGFDHPALHRPVERYGSVALSRTVKGLLKSWRVSMTPKMESLLNGLERHVQEIEDRYLAYRQLPELVIHGDYHGAHLVFQEDRIVGVVDYDQAHWCSRVMEVAEATIAFCTDPGLQLKHIVYPGVLDLDLVQSFLAVYQEEVPLSEVEIRALPDMIRTIWLCAALDPPLELPLSLEAAPSALPEILILADWAAANESEIAQICLAARVNRRAGTGMPSVTESLS